MGLQSNLSNWEGEQGTGRGNSQMELIFASFGTQRKRRRRRENGDCWYCLFCAFTVDPIGPIRYTQVAVLLLL